MTINEAMKKYRLPNPATPEDLEMRYSGMDGCVLSFGDRILVAGFYWNGPGKPSYFAATFEYLEDGEHDCEDLIGLRAASDVEFYDDGHAIAWAMQQ